MLLLWLLACGDEDPPVPEAPAPAPPSVTLTPSAPETPATPAESLAAKPDWWTSESFAPVASDAALRGPTVTPEALDGQLLACHLQVEYRGREVRLGSWSEPDLSVSFGIGQAQVVFDAEDNTSVVDFGVPLLRMSVGQEVALQVYERDGTERKRITTVSQTWDGAWPLHIQDSGATLDCHAVDEAYVAERADKALEAARDALTLPEPQVLLGHQDLGLSAWNKVLEDRLLRAASLVGWSDPRMAPLLDSYSGLLRAFDLQVKQVLAHALPDQTVTGPLDLTLIAFLSPEQAAQAYPDVPGSQGFATRGALVVEVRNDGERDEGLGYSDIGPVQLDLVDHDWHRAELSLLARRSGEGPWRKPHSSALAPGETLTLIYAWEPEHLHAPVVRARWIDEGMKGALLRAE